MTKNRNHAAPTSTDIAPTAWKAAEPFLAAISSLAAEEHEIGTAKAFLARMIERAPEKAAELYIKAGLVDEAEGARMIQDWKTEAYGMTAMDWAHETLRWVAHVSARSGRFIGVVGAGWYPHSFAGDQVPQPSSAGPGDRLIEHLAAEMRGTAKIPKSEDLNSFDFKENLWDVLRDWIYAAAYEAGPCAKLLDDTKRDAVRLRSRLEKLHLHLNQARLGFVREGRLFPPFNANCGCVRFGEHRGTQGDFELNVLEYITPSGLAHIMKMVSALIEASERICGEKTTGKPRGDRRYPGLDILVSDLEKLALFYGGRGFGLPSTSPPKGNIIRLLDRIRIYLKNDPELAWLAQFLPPPGKHPIAVYQRAIRDAREQHAREELEESEQQIHKAQTSENLE
jgi:hypothetical protein